MILLDTNILIDIFDIDSEWYGWSCERIIAADAEGPLAINAIIFAELASGYASKADLLDKIDQLAIIMADLDVDAAFLAGTRFKAYRRQQQRDGSVLPDFFIGAHALTLGIPLLTRDARLYRTYFPELTLITPETDHG